MTPPILSGSSARKLASYEAAELAGILAECGMASLELTDASGARRTLIARSVDLPGTLRCAVPCTIKAVTPHALSVSIEPDRISWTTDAPAVHEALIARLAKSS